MSNNRYEKVCKACGKTFIAKRFDTKVCSAKCRNKLYKETNPDISRGIASIGEKCDEITENVVFRAMFMLMDRESKKIEYDENEEDEDCLTNYGFTIRDMKMMAKSMIIGLHKIENILRINYIERFD